MPRRTRPREATTVLGLSKQARPPAGGTPTVALKPVEIEAVMLGAITAPMPPVQRVTTDQILEVRDVDPAAPVEARARRRSSLATGSQPVEVARELPTVALAAVEIEAILQGATSASPPAPGADDRSTVETVRLAMGSTAIAASNPAPSAPSPPTPGRGPRRARETLRAEKIRSAAQPPLVIPPTRKR